VYAFAGGWPGFSAGVLFLVGKTASVAAISLIAGSYLWPEQVRPVAVALLAVFAVVNMSGIRSTATVSLAIVAVVLVGLAVVLAPALPSVTGIDMDAVASPAGILQSAGLLFFCFAGYARMATLGAEVVDPRRTLPRAIIAALAITLVVYALVAVTVLSVLGAERLADTASPLAAVGGSEVLVRVVAGVACVGSLVGILAALSRTALAMARGGDLPGPLGFVWSRTRAPIAAEAVVALVAIAAVLVLDPARLVGFSSCAVLVYYGIAHLAALRQPAAERWLPRAVQVVGLAGCLLLAATLPWQAIVLAAGVLAVGIAARLLVRTVKA
jgi:APA family basic amino acid/polyamine antiporter